MTKSVIKCRPEKVARRPFGPIAKRATCHSPPPPPPPTAMGGGWFPKLVWPKHNMVNQQVKVGVANNNKRAKCWCDTGNVGAATATPAIRHSPYILHIVIYVRVGQLCPSELFYECAPAGNPSQEQNISTEMTWIGLSLYQTVQQTSALPTPNGTRS